MSMKNTIEGKLAARFEPTALEVLDESGNHNVPAGAESHFRVTVVSDAFADTALLARHRASAHKRTRPPTPPTPTAREE